MKRPNGTGSVYKLNGRRRRPWIATVVKGYDNETGAPNRIILGYFKTKTEALMALSAETIAMVSERYNFTFEQVYIAWKRKPSYNELSKSMKDGYASAFNHWGDIHKEKIRLLRTFDYQEIINEKQDEGYSESHCKKMRVLAGMLCRWAMENDIINKNYASFVEIQSDNNPPKEIFTDEHIQLFIQHKDDREAQIILALIFSGMRPGELAKVVKDDRLHLNEKYIINGSKTNAGKNRVIPLCDFILPIFTAAALASSPGETIFKSPEGKALSVSHFRKREFYPYLEKLGIAPNPYAVDENGERISDDPPRFVPYTCRHTFASLSNRAGVKKEILQKAIGHVVGSDITDKVYIHEQIGEYSAEFSKLNLLATVLATSKNY